MVDVLLLLGSFLASYLGFALMALTLDRHWRDITDRPKPDRQLVLRIGGYGLLVAAFAMVFVSDGPSFGALLWILGLGAAAYALAMTLAWRAEWLRPLAHVVSQSAPAGAAAASPSPRRPPRPPSGVAPAPPGARRVARPPGAPPPGKRPPQRPPAGD
ncbi:MAG: DUF3325 domain-containing protein [Bacteroidota bacterium]